MVYQIDQSGKIEDTSKNTILCLSNSKWTAVKIEAKTKRQLQEIFRRNGRPRNFVLFTFAAGLAILIDKRPDVNAVLIDQEYYGKEAVIKNILLQMLNERRNLLKIEFGRIGKRAMAHHRAYAVNIGKAKVSYVVKLNELLDKMKKTEVGKRLKDV